MINFDWLQPFIIVLASSGLRAFQQDCFLCTDKLFQAKLAFNTMQIFTEFLPCEGFQLQMFVRILEVYKLMWK